MTVIERINIKPIDLRLQKVKECTEYFIELRDNSLGRKIYLRDKRGK